MGSKLDAQCEAKCLRCYLEPRDGTCAIQRSSSYSLLQGDTPKLAHGLFRDKFVGQNWQAIVVQF